MDASEEDEGNECGQQVHYSAQEEVLEEAVGFGLSRSEPPSTEIELVVFTYVFKTEDKSKGYLDGTG